MIRLDKCYITRDGRPVTGLRLHDDPDFPVTGRLDGSLETWTAEGKYCIGRDSDWDLMETLSSVDFNKTYKTRNGLPVTGLRQDSYLSCYPITGKVNGCWCSWTAEGLCYDGETNAFDLIEVEDAP